MRIYDRVYWASGRRAGCCHEVALQRRNRVPHLGRLAITLRRDGPHRSGLQLPRAQHALQSAGLHGLIWSMYALQPGGSTLLSTTFMALETTRT
jgi:hypothetical protein